MAEVKKVEASEPKTKSQRDRIISRLPDGLDDLRSIHDEHTAEMLEIAETLVATIRKKIDVGDRKPRVPQVHSLFSKQAGKVPSVKPEVDEKMRNLDHIQRIATLDQSYDKSMAQAYNTFDKVSVDCGANVQEAYDSWIMAVRVYESECRSAGAIFLAAVEIARKKERDNRGGEWAAEDVQLQFYTKSTDLASALKTYESAISKAANDLAKSFGSLVAGVYSGVTKVSAGEASLISSTQTASLTFWKGVHSEFGNRRS